MSLVLLKEKHGLQNQVRSKQKKKTLVQIGLHYSMEVIYAWNSAFDSYNINPQAVLGTQDPIAQVPGQVSGV